MMIRDVMRHGGAALGVSRRALASSCRRQRLAHKRQVVMTLCRHYSRASLPKIAQIFCRHHTTVMCGMEAVAARCADPDYFQTVATVCALIEIETTAQRIEKLNRGTPCQSPPPIALLPPPWHRLAKGRA